jgi:hypothetical protein
MKITDYAPRSGALDAHLTRMDLTGIEVGCDVGAHAEALLRYCGVRHLTVVDLWDKEFYRGYCMGRLQSQGWKNKTAFLQMTSHQAAQGFGEDAFDFIYLDIGFSYELISEALVDWWPKLKAGGLMGCRNYAPSTPENGRAINEFIELHGLKSEFERYHGEIVLFK